MTDFRAVLRCHDPGVRNRISGKCGESGHSIRTCQEMKAVSAAGLKEVIARYGKTESCNSQQAAQLGVRATKAA
jgi:hypothetical protein